MGGKQATCRAASVTCQVHFLVDVRRRNRRSDAPAVSWVAVSCQGLSCGEETHAGAARRHRPSVSRRVTPMRDKSTGLAAHLCQRERCVQHAGTELRTGVEAVPSAGEALAAVLADLLQELGDERRPPGLVAGAHAGAVVAVEVFVEGQQVAPVRIALELVRAAEYGASPVGIAQEEARQPMPIARSRPPTG